MGKYVTRLEKIFAQLSAQSPFTKKEKSELSKRDQVFVRNLQIKDKSSKAEAIKKYKDNILKGPEEYKKLRDDTISYVKELYPVHDKKIPQTTEPTRAGQKLKIVSKTDQQKILNKSSKRERTKLQKGWKKYPDASQYEIHEGINSVRSQKYRIRNGRPAQYEGRVIKP